jgi:hypothetical protein
MRLYAIIHLRRAEVAALKVGDRQRNRTNDSLRGMGKGGRRDVLATTANSDAAPSFFEDVQWP